MAAIVSMVSRHGLWIEARHRHQLNKSKLAPYKLTNNHLKQLYVSNKQSNSVIKMSVAYTYQGILKEELAWAIAKQLWFISSIMQLYQ